MAKRRVLIKKKSTKSAVKPSAEVLYARAAIRQAMSAKKNATLADLAAALRKYPKVRLEETMRISGIGAANLYKTPILEVTKKLRANKVTGNYHPGMEIVRALAGKLKKDEKAIYPSVIKTLAVLVEDGELEVELVNNRPMYRIPA